MPDQLSKRKGIWVYIKLDGGGFASSPEFDLRWELEDAIIDRDIGELQGAGSGGGWMDFSFSVPDIDAVGPALLAVKALLKEYKVPDELVRLEVVRQYDQVCDEIPDFKAGDCLSFRFEDGDFGAAVVLSRWNEEMQRDDILLGLLDYKEAHPANPGVFQQRNWLICTHQSRQGQPYIVWVYCFGGIVVDVLHHLSLTDDDPVTSRSRLSWDLIPEYFIREKYRGDPSQNPYEVVPDMDLDYQPGDCIGYRFADGDYGAAIVLGQSDDGPNLSEVLLGILDYKDRNPPLHPVFEQRKWLTARQNWREGEPYLVWASQLEEIEVEVLNRIPLAADDPMYCEFGIHAEDLSEHVIYERKLQ